MARGGVYKSDVGKARKQLISKRKRPSVALNTAPRGAGSYGGHSASHRTS